MAQQYQPGQRWISDSEAELGLGTILAQDGRLLTVLYPATGDTRQYSLRNAPLTRVRFSPGDQITHFEGWKLTVREVEDIDGLMVYHGLDGQNQPRTLPETQLSNFIQFRLASDRLFAGQIDPLSWFSLRYNTLQHTSKQMQSALWGLGGCRAQPIAHQLHIAREVADRSAPRVLLADEVGLGKTIEAGLVIHRQLLSGRANRVLILVPENLQHQWLVEMRRRFNLQVALFDAERFIESDASNPFEDAQLALVALEWLVDDEKAQDALFAAGWDLMVVDEAHHLVWHEDQASTEYSLVEQLAQVIPGVLLLTATPEQLGQDSHFARLRLLDPNRFHDLAAFRAESEHYRPVAEAVQELLDEGRLSPKAHATIQGFLGAEGEALLAAVNDGDTQASARLIRELLDRHGTGRVLFRNTRAAIQGFPERQLHPYPLATPEQYRDLPAGEHAELYPEVAFQAQGEAADDERWWRFDPRVDWLIDTLKMLKRTKVLVICAHAETAMDLEDALRVRSGIPASVFHEGMSILERDRAAAYFADEEFGAQVLICSEIGSEGRNFQFAHHLVMFDLPAHPDLLEQRIGRLDRIGQKHTIQLHIPYLQDSPQERLFQWYHEGLNAFLNTCPTGNALQHQFGPRLLPLLEGGESKAWDALVADARGERERLEAELHTGRDRLLELNSGGAGEGQALVEDILEQDDQFALPIYMETLFDAFGIDSEDHSENALILKPSEKMLDASFPLGDDEGVTITYDRAQALSREDMQFLTWEHPMVQGGMDLVLSGSMGNTAVALIKNKALKPGTVLLELLFVSEVVAPRSLQLGRYLPPAALRCLLDANGNDLASRVAFETLNDQLESVPRASANKFVQAQRDVLAKRISGGEEKILPIHVERVAEAQRRLAAEADEELARLVALQAVNPSVRDSEIDALRKQREDGLAMLEKAALRLEAIRVLVAG
ncbi:TPA: RNA polymerase-associated protein RapA [Pseudomonas putida]|uniref:RNA polymerase-associated protein RapA n=1 Tax=Pseudomonas putida (strain GB-1) TaxID=76869 RepID=RAPA_PSEPG|nr:MULTISPECIES: RNA polymerase-associated protein RapA [Pseudomonas]B0KU95.1 RecName: Full=RNA polymerase-associated protein RapA; AltName: Full=ATP-dependent helicase HepA [Pseudomonas putida GB-1]ABZ00161.1 SNF2-related protein [Pseudomonas putida GB-1]APF00292.1 RNA polymerase-binding ATPase [Pseudomonas putida]MBP0708198.1 RNA polymerase-associated protein RapA [Pseudomonas sp. T34]MCE0999934.1 RNA polymerase-associated protein RapA [Pseudomonas sp. NMI1173_11]MCK2187635.1 RNA polymerase